jgi:hypothetical protein
MNIIKKSKISCHSLEERDHGVLTSGSSWRLVTLIWRSALLLGLVLPPDLAAPAAMLDQAALGPRAQLAALAPGSRSGCSASCARGVQLQLEEGGVAGGDFGEKKTAWSSCSCRRTTIWES